MKTSLTEFFGIEHPIVSGPMALISGGQARGSGDVGGGLGLIGGGYGDSDAAEDFRPPPSLSASRSVASTPCVRQLTSLRTSPRKRIES